MKHSNLGLWIESGIFSIAFLLLVPSIAVLIGCGAWKGKPKNFSREMYWTLLVSVGAASCVLLAYAIRMDADVRTWQHLLQLASIGLGALLLGIAGGCGVGIFTYRRGSFPEDNSDRV